MAFQFHELTPAVRRLMLDELYEDMAQGRMVYSRRLRPDAEREWDGLLDEAIQGRNEAWLAHQLTRADILKSHEERHLANGTVVQAKVPWTAAQMMAEGEFNRYYARAICRLAKERGLTYVEVYRAKPVLTPRRRSQRFVGTLFHAETLYLDLRAHPDGSSALGLLAPNSGLSVRTTTVGTRTRIERKSA
jgi:hypothetical protein